MDFYANVTSGFAIAFTPMNVLFAFVGAVLGTAIGVLPGLGPATTIAMLLPITYTMEPTSAIIMLSGIYYGAMYGGSTTSILLNIPGESSSVVTCLDGYKMARQGRAGAALGMSAMGSFIAGTLSVLLMQLVAPVLANYALKFGPAEYASLILCGLLLAVYLSEGSVLKGLLMMFAGLLLGMVGIDPVHGEERFTFGILRLTDGINFVVVAMGFFAVSEVLMNLSSPGGTADIFNTTIKGLLPTRDDWRRCWAPIARGTLIGFFVGALPGAGAVIASFMAYVVEKKISKHPEQFGEGAIEGVAAPESANNAAATGAFVPLLTLGIPGSNTTAMIFVALMIHGIQPGPLLIQEHPNLFWGVIASMYVGNVMLLCLNLPLIGFWVRLLKVPYHYLAVLIVVIVMLGGYQIKNSAFDVGMIVIFGVIGYFARKNGFPVAPCVLALILGRKLEQSVQQALKMSGADLGIFIQKPISATILAIVLVAMMIPVFTWAWKRYVAPSKGAVR
jgi:putative tricarboxylic transport membrane protein